MNEKARDKQVASKERIGFVTGRLAASALTEMVHQLSEPCGFIPQVVTTKISVAALMTVDWLVHQLPKVNCDRLVVPGWCQGDLNRLSAQLGGIPVDRGPKDLRDLPDYFQQTKAPINYGCWDIEILAEINHANRLDEDQLIAQAQSLSQDGADIVDLGMTPGETWDEVGDAVRKLLDCGLQVSIDSFDPREVQQATAAGAKLVLSVNSANRKQAVDWGCEVVVLPDDPHADQWLDSLEETAEFLDSQNIPYRLDPILEPIGFGFAQSLVRYHQTRHRFPNAEIMMGIGNLTELTEVDSAGVNATLIGVCQELGIRSVLTTQVINWARSSVKEIAIARELMHYAVSQRKLPKHVDSRLVTLRGTKVTSLSDDQLRDLHQAIKDKNFRLFATDEGLVAMNVDVLATDSDAFLLFDQLPPVEPSHAFYLGWELSKAATARQLGKRYVQDEALDWGFLTQEEVSHRDRKRQQSKQEKPNDP